VTVSKVILIAVQILGFQNYLAHSHS